MFPSLVYYFTPYPAVFLGGFHWHLPVFRFVCLSSDWLTGLDPVCWPVSLLLTNKFLRLHLFSLRCLHLGPVLPLLNFMVGSLLTASSPIESPEPRVRSCVQIVKKQAITEVYAWVLLFTTSTEIFAVPLMWTDNLKPLGNAPNINKSVM